MKRKLVTLLLALCCVFGLSAFFSCNLGNTATLEYTLSDDGTYYILSRADAKKPNTEIVIPATYKKLPVAAIGPFAFNINFNKDWFLTNYLSEEKAYPNSFYLTSVTIPDSVTSIGKKAFYGCYSLTSITIPDSVTSIGNEAFAGCNHLIEIENGISYVDKWVVDCDESIGKSLPAIVLRTDTKGIANYAFEYGNSLTSVTIPDSVTSIGYAAFTSCPGLRSVTLGNGVTSIGEDAFSSCPWLRSITVDENNKNYKSIDGNLYSKDGTTLIRYAQGKTATEFTIPDSVTSIGEDAFSSCSSLTSVTIPDSVTSIGYAAFSNCSSLTEITIPNSVTEIGDNAFSGCSSLTSVTIPDSVTSIGEKAFFGCSSLTSVTIPDSVTSIGNDAFEGCNNLTSVYITDIVAWCAIDFKNSSSNPFLYRIFSKNTNLYLNNELVTNLIIPNSVTSIGGYAFAGCDSLTSVTIPDSVTSIGYAAFSDCDSLTSVIFKNIEGWKTYYNDRSYEEMPIPSTDLANTATAAEYLRNTYTSYTWTRSDE